MKQVFYFWIRICVFEIEFLRSKSESAPTPANDDHTQAQEEGDRGSRIEEETPTDNDENGSGANGG